MKDGYSWELFESAWKDCTIPAACKSVVTYIIIYQETFWQQNCFAGMLVSAERTERLRITFLNHDFCHFKIFFFGQGSVKKLYSKNWDAYFQGTITTFTLKFKLEFVMFLIWGMNLAFWWRAMPCWLSLEICPLLELKCTFIYFIYTPQPQPFLLIL